MKGPTNDFNIYLLNFLIRFKIIEIMLHVGTRPHMVSNSWRVLVDLPNLNYVLEIDLEANKQFHFYLPLHR